MKKFFLLFVMAVMTAVTTNAQTAIPSDDVLNRYRAADANVVVGFYTDASFCNDLVFAGSYNNWNVAEVDSLVRFVPVDNFSGWYVCSFYADGLSDQNGICGKVVALRADGAFEWGCQWGSDVQLLRGNAWLYEELPGEMMLRDIDTSAPVVLSSSKWKGGADPCALKQTYTIYLDAPSCADAEGNTFQPAVIGDFTGWSELIPMTQLASGSSCMCTFEAYPGQTFRFLAMGEDIDWNNQLQIYSASEDAWVDASIITLDTMSQLGYDFSEGRYGYCVNVPTPEPEPVNYGLRAVTGVPVVIDSMRTNIAAHPEMFVIGFEGYESGDLWFGTPVVEYGAELCSVTAKLNLYTAATSSYLCLLEVQSYAAGGRFGGHVTLYAQTLDPASGRVLHSDSLEVPFSGMILGPEPEPEPEPEDEEPDFISMPDRRYEYVTGGQIQPAICRIEGGSRNCRIEWGWLENYIDPELDYGSVSSSDITKKLNYHFLKEDTAYSMVDMNADGIQELVLKGEFNPTNYSGMALDNYFYCRVYQGENLLNEAAFTYVNYYHVRRISIYPPLESVADGDSVESHMVGVGVEGPSVDQSVYINYYNALDTAATAPVSVFRNGNQYYAQVETPFSSFLDSTAVVDAKTLILWDSPLWYEMQVKRGEPYDMSGRLRSPLFAVDDVTWYALIQFVEDEEGANGYAIEASLETNDQSMVVDSTQIEMSLDGETWMPLTGEEVETSEDGAFAYLPITSIRPGTYYFRFVAYTNKGEHFSMVYTVKIGGGINIDLENVVEGAIEYDAETKTVTVSGAVIEEVETALTNLEADVTIALEGITTIVAAETGILTSGDITIYGSFAEDYSTTDTTTIVAPRPFYASAEGVKITFDGASLHLVVPGHEGDVVPGEEAARRQMSPMMRARYIARTVLLTQDAEGESVISGFDEVNFVNCGVIEPEGANYNDDQNELLCPAGPVYNCTIVPMEVEEEGFETVETEKVAADKRIRQGAIYILRQDRVYTVMGQLVK